MIRIATFLGLLGLVATTCLILWSGFDGVLAALEVAGWGIIVTSLFHVVPMFACVIGWRQLMPGRTRPSLAYMMYVLWLRTSVNNMLPVARVGGEIVAVRVMTKQGMHKNTAVASTVIELTTSVLAVFLFDVAGIGLFAWRVPDHELAWKLVAALLFSLPPIGGLIVMQSIGFFGLIDRIFSLMLRDKWSKYVGSAARLDRAVRVMYRRKKRVLICGFWQLIAWVLGTGEVALGLHFLGHPLKLIDCFMIEAFVQASTSAAFVVPGALGIQDATFVFFGHMLGLPREVATALALLRRCRDILLYVPGLIAWQIQEGRWLFGKGSLYPTKS